MVESLKPESGSMRSRSRIQNGSKEIVSFVCASVLEGKHNNRP
jgi:hypothetical protein